MPGQRYATAAAAAAAAPDAEGQEPSTQQEEGSPEGGLSREQMEQALHAGKVNAVCMAMRAAVEARMKGQAAGAAPAAGDATGDAAAAGDGAVAGYAGDAKGGAAARDVAAAGGVGGPQGMLLQHGMVMQQVMLLGCHGDASAGSIAAAGDDTVAGGPGGPQEMLLQQMGLCVSVSRDESVRRRCCASRALRSETRACWCCYRRCCRHAQWLHSPEPLEDDSKGVAHALLLCVCVLRATASRRPCLWRLCIGLPRP
eukprot:scaffold58177_cov19-Tisochrysis_lutea.AAC.4